MVIRRNTNEEAGEGDDGPMTGINVRVPIPDYRKWQGLRTTAERKIKTGELEEEKYKKLSVRLRRAFKDYLRDLEDFIQNGKTMR